MAENDYIKNLMALKKCKRIYRGLFLAYFIICVPYASGIFLHTSLKVFTYNEIPKLILCLTFAAALFATGILSIFRKDPRLTWLPVMVSVVCAILLKNIIIILLTVISSALLTATHKKYKWLESQEGFPYFNQRFEEQKNTLAEQQRHSPYQQHIERYKSSSGKMDEI